MVCFRLFVLTDIEKGSYQLANRIRRKAASFHLTTRENGLPALSFMERNGTWSWCVRPGQRRLTGAYYLPRMRDTVEFCRTCSSCQCFGPRNPSQTVLPIPRHRHRRPQYSAHEWRLTRAWSRALRPANTRPSRRHSWPQSRTASLGRMALPPSTFGALLSEPPSRAASPTPSVQDEDGDETMGVSADQQVRESPTVL